MNDNLQFCKYSPNRIFLLLLNRSMLYVIKFDSLLLPVLFISYFNNFFSRIIFTLYAWRCRKAMSDANRQSSPKSSSPRGSRSPATYLRPDSTGTLKATITLGKNPAVINTGPFYLLKELPGNQILCSWCNFSFFYNIFSNALCPKSTCYGSTF